MANPYTRTFISATAPSAPSVGDLWLNPSTRVLKACVQVDPSILFITVQAITVTVTVANATAANAVTIAAANAANVPAGGTGAAAGGWDTAANRDTAITNINAAWTLVNDTKTSANAAWTLVNELKAQLNSLLAQLRASGVIS